MFTRLKLQSPGRLLLSSDSSWSSQLLARWLRNCDKSHSDVDCTDEDTERRRSVPAPTLEEIVKTMRVFDNPLDRRPDIIYHHPTQYNDYSDYTNGANVYETINHQENPELSSSK